MGASAYVGRVGRLAVVLGVGTAIAMGHGAAVAGADETTSSASSSSESTGSGSATKAGDGDTAAGAKQTGTTKAGVKKAERTRGGDTTRTRARQRASEEAAASDEKKSDVGTRPRWSKPTTKPAKTAAKTATKTAAETAEDVASAADTETAASSAQPADSSATPAPPQVVAQPDPIEPASPTEPTSAAEPAAEPEPTREPETTAAPPPPVSSPATVERKATTRADADTSRAAKPTAEPERQPALVADTAPLTRAATTVDEGPAMALLSASALTDGGPTDPTPPAAARTTVSEVSTAVRPSIATAISKVVSDVVNAVVGAFFGSGSRSPAQPPLGWALLAFARREVGSIVDAVTVGPAASAPVTNLALSSVALAALEKKRPDFPPPGHQFSPSTSFVDWVTGNYPLNDTHDSFDIYGTDIGTMWWNGMEDDPATTEINERQVLIAVGDTFGEKGMVGNWRFNTILRSGDDDLADGMTLEPGQWFNGNMFGGAPLSAPTVARQVLFAPKGLPAGVTLIPTAGIAVPTPGTRFGVTQYMSFMSVKKWGTAGKWTTNYSAMAFSIDNGETWEVVPSTVRYNQSWTGHKNFQQSAFVRPGDGYVYVYGTPNGRQGYAYLARVPEEKILDLTQYEYYSKGKTGYLGKPAGWYKNDPGAATAVFGQDKGSCGAANPGNRVSELSVQYNKSLNKYVTLYGDQFNNIVMRTSDTPEGAWSSATVLMNQQPGGIYAPMLHPWSPSTEDTGTDLYWNLSLWSEYNVMLMKTDLSKV